MTQSGYVVWSPRQGQWPESPEPDSKMQRKRTGPGAARAVPQRGNPGKLGVDPGV
jgi:hypothetical protein